MARSIAVVALLLIGELLPQGSDSPTLAQLLARAGEFVRYFQQDFASVVSDEDYRQDVTSRQYSTPPPASRDDVDRLPSKSERRRTRSEMLFLWMPDEAAWLTVRNVLAVDEEPVPDSQNRLNEAFGTTSVDRGTRLRVLRDASARFNLGTFYRNINYPTLALQYLDPAMQPRFAFTLAGRERIAGVQTAKIAFEERSRPTFIQEDGTDRVSNGMLWVAEADAAIVRTHLELRIPQRETTMAVDVDYRRDDRFHMWVPARMHEVYRYSRSSILLESVECVASYSNFRRFETSGRMILPK